MLYVCEVHFQFAPTRNVNVLFFPAVPNPYQKSTGPMNKFHPHFVPVLAGAIGVSSSNFTITNSRKRRDGLSRNEGKEVGRRQLLLRYVYIRIKLIAPSYF